MNNLNERIRVFQIKTKQAVKWKNKVEGGEV